MSFDGGLLSVIAFAVALGLIGISFSSSWLFREGFFARVSLWITITAVFFAIHAATRAFILSPYADLVYAITGFVAAVTVLFALIVITRFLREAVNAREVVERG
ncbi:MAG: hypothetical protein ACE5HJ_06555 [Thermoplasmata archaeon]